MLPLSHPAAANASSRHVLVIARVRRSFRRWRQVARMEIFKERSKKQNWIQNWWRSWVSVQLRAPCFVPIHATLSKRATLCSLLALHEKQCPLRFFLSGLFIETRRSKKCGFIGNRTSRTVSVWQYSHCNLLPVTAYLFFSRTWTIKVSHKGGSHSRRKDARGQGSFLNLRWGQEEAMCQSCFPGWAFTKPRRWMEMQGLLQ